MAEIIHDIVAIPVFARVIRADDARLVLQELDAALAAPPPETELPFDPDQMTHAWAILCAEVVARDGKIVPNPDRWEPDRYNAAAFVAALLGQYAALASPADPPTEHRLYARNPNIPRSEDDPAWCVCGVPWPCPSADPDMEERLAGDLHAARIGCLEYVIDGIERSHADDAAAHQYDAARLIAQGWRR